MNNSIGKFSPATLLLIVPIQLPVLYVLHQKTFDYFKLLLPLFSSQLIILPTVVYQTTHLSKIKNVCSHTCISINVLLVITYTIKVTSELKTTNNLPSFTVDKILLFNGCTCFPLLTTMALTVITILNSYFTKTDLQHIYINNS